MNMKTIIIAMNKLKNGMSFNITWPSMRTMKLILF